MKKAILLPAALLCFLASCKKDPVNNPTNPTTNTPSSTAPTPSFTTGDGFIVALNTTTSTTVNGIPIDVSVGTGIAAFGNLSNSTYNDAGTITLNGKALSKQSNNTYVYTPSQTDPTGIDLSSSINWSVGNPSFTYNAATQGKGMPTGGGWNGATTSINTGSDLTVSVKSTISNADSVYYLIIANDGKQLLQRKAGNVGSVTFSAADLGTLKKGAGYLEIIPWNHEQKTLGGKQVHVINEVANVYGVEIK